MEKDYQMSESEKEVHDIGLDLLKKLKDICVKYNLTFFANAGTLLGAARHAGFIPWDDDIDISMAWQDYQKLLKVAPVECHYPYFFQSHLTEDGAEVDHVKIRRSDTTGFSKWEYENIKNPDHNMGIWLDIFPMFNVPRNATVRNKKKEIIFSFWKAIRGYNAQKCIEYGSKPNSKYAEYIPNYLKMSRKFSITEIKTMYLDSCVYEEETDEIGETSFRTYDEKFIYRKEWYASSIELPFENTTIPCPEHYDEILTKAYGSWRTPVINSAVHEMAFVNTHLPYSEYLSSTSK